MNNRLRDILLGGLIAFLSLSITIPLATLASIAPTNPAVQGYVYPISTSQQIVSTVPTGTAPIAVTSTTPVANLSIGGNAATATTATNLSGGTVSATTIAASGLISPTGTIGILGNSTGSNMQAGSMGEHPTPGSATGVSLTSGSLANCTTMSLTKGDWDVKGFIAYLPAGTTLQTAGSMSISTSSLTNGPLGSTVQFNGLTIAAGSVNTLSESAVQINVSSTTTVYLVVSAAFTVSTLTANCFISARRAD